MVRLLSCYVSLLISQINVDLLHIQCILSSLLRKIVLGNPFSFLSDRFNVLDFLTNERGENTKMDIPQPLTLTKVMQTNIPRLSM